MKKRVAMAMTREEGGFEIYRAVLLFVVARYVKTEGSVWTGGVVYEVGEVGMAFQDVKEGFNCNTIAITRQLVLPWGTCEMKTYLSTTVRLCNPVRRLMDCVWMFIIPMCCLSFAFILNACIPNVSCALNVRLPPVVSLKQMHTFMSVIRSRSSVHLFSLTKM